MTAPNFKSGALRQGVTPSCFDQRIRMGDQEVFSIDRQGLTLAIKADNGLRIAAANLLSHGRPARDKAQSGKYEAAYHGWISGLG